MSQQDMKPITKVTISILVLIYALLLPLTIPQTEAQASWFSTVWKYRKSHVINPSSGAGTNYQVKIITHFTSGTDSGENVYLEAKCRSDFGDIRFTDDDGITLLDYWMEGYNFQVNATFWVEVLDDLSSSSVTIYIYYGNPTVTTTSNGTSTFWDFDDFEYTDNITLHGWTIEKVAAGGVITTTTEQARVGSYSLRFDDPDTAGANIIHRWIPNFTRALIHLFMRPERTTINPSQVLKEDAALTLYARWGFATNAQFYFYNGTSYYLGSYSANTWYRFETVFNSDTDVYEKIIIDGVEKISNAGLANVAPYFSFYRIFSASKTATGTCYVDCFYVRKWVDPEPAHGTWGVEESWKTAPSYGETGLNSTLNGYPAEFKVVWTDDLGLSGFIFSTNNSGTWANSTWTVLTGTQATATYTITLNDTVGVRVEWKVYCNDSFDNWAVTPNMYLIVNVKLLGEFGDWWKIGLAI